MLESKPVNILDLNLEQLKEWLSSVQESVHQADSITNWIYRRVVPNYAEMVDLKPALKGKLEELSRLTTLTTLDENISTDGQTRKLLLQTDDGKTIETALMCFKKNGISRERRTVCVSSQVGCAVGCKFCATGQQGFERNLRPGEIVEQILFFMRYLRDRTGSEEKRNFWPFITHVVFMGMGEPLANFENVRRAIHILNSPRGLNLGARQITLSTSGLVPQIRLLAEDNLQFELAISLHGATDKLRNSLVPVNQKYPLSELKSACQDYFIKTGRKPFFEYALFSGLNDTLKDAVNLLKFLEDFKCSVNLIVGNETSNPEYQPASMESALEFQKVLMEGGVRILIRNSKGSDIEAGCGQLRSRWSKSSVNTINIS
jgi:23S rRNA (adenine2503-C2)-methyltransferase